MLPPLLDPEERLEPPLLDPEERLEPPPEDDVLGDEWPEDDGRLTDPDPPLRVDDPPLRVDDPELLPPLRVDGVDPRLPPEEVEPRVPLGVSRAPPIEPMTRRTVSPAPRHDSFEVPRVDVEVDEAPAVEGLLTGVSPPPRVVVRGVTVLLLVEPGEVESLRTGRPLHSLPDELVLPPELGRPTV